MKGLLCKVFVAVDEMSLKKLLESLALVRCIRGKDIASKEEREHGSTREFRVICRPKMKAGSGVVVELVDVGCTGDFEMADIHTGNFKCPSGSA